MGEGESEIGSRMAENFATRQKLVSEGVPEDEAAAWAATPRVPPSSLLPCTVLASRRPSCRCGPMLGSPPHRPSWPGPTLVGASPTPSGGPGCPAWAFPALTEALAGRSASHHAVVVRAILAHIDLLDANIAALDEEVAGRLGPFRATIELLN